MASFQRFLKTTGCLISVALGIVAAGGGGAGCSGQGEGERCTFFMPHSGDASNYDGTDECQAGLQCYPGTMFANSQNQYGVYDRCCPPMSELSNPRTDPRCFVPATPTTDASIDASTDASADVSKDAHKDAAEDGKKTDAERDASGDVEKDVGGDARDGPTDATKD